MGNVGSSIFGSRLVLETKSQDVSVALGFMFF